MRGSSVTSSYSGLLAALAVPVYTTDAEGYITFYNDAAAQMWGQRPDLGSSRWCGSWRLYQPDGTPLAHHDCSMALTLRGGHPVVGAEAVSERLDGSRIPFMPYPSLVRNDTGEVTGAINLLVNLSDRNHAELHQERLAAIVSSSNDIIISKTLDGIITSWNGGATRLLGFDESEMIGQHISRIIPAELAHEEEAFIGKLRRGERIEHFDTERLTKIGKRVYLSLTLSPLRDRTGRVVGASKVARDITDRKIAEETRRLLINELNHRVKNTLATIQAIAGQSLRHSASPQDFVTSFTGRVQALAKAHDLLVSSSMKAVRLAQLIEDQVLSAEDGARIFRSGPDVMLEPHAAVQLALVLHELASNVRRHGSLSVPDGTLDISWTLVGGEISEVSILWRETGMQNLSTPDHIGFGSALIAQSLESLRGSTVVEYDPAGLSCQIMLPLAEVGGQNLANAMAMMTPQPETFSDTAVQATLRGRRILVVEDEPIVAMDIEDQLTAEGMVVVGLARTLQQARRMANDEIFEVALLDANLNGHPVDEIAKVLTLRGIPFAFASGYGREALPAGFDATPVLTKPFTGEALISVVNDLLGVKESF